MRMTTDEKYMRAALKQAEKAYNKKTRKRRKTERNSRRYDIKSVTI